MEGGQTPFPHVTCQHVVTRKLYSSTTRSSTLLKTLIASHVCGHQLQENLWISRVNFPFSGNYPIVLVAQSCRFFAIPWTVARQTPRSMEFSRQEYWSGLPCPSPGNRPDSGIKPLSLVSCIDRQVLYPRGHLGRAH